MNTAKPVTACTRLRALYFGVDQTGANAALLAAMRLCFTLFSLETEGFFRKEFLEKRKKSG